MRQSYGRPRSAFERTHQQPVREFGKLSLIFSREFVRNLCEF